jgi:SAM-dependent methyltransferase
VGTSNWQQIPFCVEAMMKIAPQRVLDIGVGFGRWGIVTREFCDVWFGRVQRPQWRVHVEGVEAYPKNIDAYHASFYDKVHIGDLRQLLPKLDGHWDLVIFGDVLEHFEKQEGKDLLDWALRRSDYVLVNIPLGENWEQGEKYENPYERHLSQWAAEEFDPFFVRRRAFFRDYIDRPSGSFILSKTDPRGLAGQLFSRASLKEEALPPAPGEPRDGAAESPGCVTPQTLPLYAELSRVKQELAAVRNTVGYRLVERLRRWRLFPVLHKTARTILTLRARLSHKLPLPAPAVRAGAATRAAAAWRFEQGDPRHPVVAICHPRWQGARSAAEGRTPNLLLAPEIGRAEIEAIVARLRASGATHFVVDGFQRGYADLVTLMRKTMPQARIHCVYHGSFFQMLEDPSLPATLAQIFRLQQQGVFDRVGFCKAGMADAFRQLGVPAHEVLNRVPLETATPLREWKTPSAVFIPVGAQLRKNPHTQLLGALLCKDVDEIHLTSKLDLQYLPPSALNGVTLKLHDGLSREATRRLMAQANVVLYATISECAPMVVLESLAAGVPCLTGNNHGLFDGIAELARHLIVSRTDDPWSIAAAISHLKRNYRACGAEIQAFNEHYERRAAQSLIEFLSLSGAEREEVPHVRRLAG